MQFDKKLEMNSNIFRPFFLIKSDTFNFSINYKLEFYLNNSAPNQENMDVRYFSKGYSNFNSLQLVFDSKFFDMVFEPYIKNDNFYYVESVIRNGTFKNLNDRVLTKNEIFRDKHVRNLLIFPNFKLFWHRLPFRQSLVGTRLSFKPSNDKQFLAILVHTL